MEGPVRALAAELASFDVTASTREGEQPGMMARGYRLQLHDSPSLTAAWSAFLLGADEIEVRQAICGVLDQLGTNPTSLPTALARLLGTDPNLRRPTEQDVEPEPDIIAKVRLPRDIHLMLTDALISIFTPESLRSFLRLRLHQSLDALVPGDQESFADSVRQLVTALEQRGLLLELVARSREVAPGDARLLRAAAVVGLDTPLAGALGEAERRVEAAGLDVNVWLDSLGELEGQICRVQVGEKDWKTGFLVGADLVLTSAAVTGRMAATDLRCRFDAKESRDGDLVTPGIAYDVLELVAERVVRGGPGGWALLRVSGSPGVQPIGGDSVESSTGTLRGWVDMSPPPSRPLSDRLLLLGPWRGGTVRLMIGEAGPVSTPSELLITFDLPTSEVSAGAPICSGDLTPVGLLVGVDLDRDGQGTSLGIKLEAVLTDLSELGLDHLVRTALA
jgi:hypothetical protein